MPFSEEEKVRIRHHLGYTNVQQVSTFAIGTPAAVETQFLIEAAMDRVMPAAEVMVRERIAICDAVEAQMVENQELLAVTQVGEIGIRQDEFEQLKKRYDWWRGGMANALGVYPDPFDKRQNGMLTGINVRVNH